MRLGLKDEEEGVGVMTMLEDYPIDFVVLHPRLGVELYEGSPDLAAFGRFVILHITRLSIAVISFRRMIIEGFPPLFQRLMHGCWVADF